jgi:hypothetical protein
MTDSFGTGAISLQSGIVVAALIVAILVMERLGGIEGLGRKIIQVALAVAITLTVFSGTQAFLGEPDAPEGGLAGFSDSQEGQEELERFLKASAARDSEKGSLHLGVGIALAVTGGALLRRLRVLPTSLLLGGILLLLLGSTTESGSTSSGDSLSALYAPLLQYANDAGQAREIIRFFVLLAGTALLLGFLVARWEVPPDGRGEPAQPPEPPEQPDPEQAPLTEGAAS